MSVNRYFEIIYLLLDRKTVTAKELAEHFEVSTRTIYRDIDALSGAGIPVYATKGKGGGISLLEGYSLNTSLLTNKEQEEILIGLQALAATDFPNADSVLPKLARLFKKEAASWIDVDFSPWGSGPKNKQLFSLLREAVTQHAVIRFRYFNAEGEISERRAEPIQLLFKQNAWYLSGFCLSKMDSRVFKISRMRDVTLTGETFIPKTPPAAIEQAEKQMADTSIPITLRISSKGAYRVYDEFDDSMITKNEGGSFTIHCRFPAGRWLDQYLLSYGTLLEDIQPAELSARIVAMLDELRDNLTNNL
ncbi:helix-turn-helix transcriptional regulator [Bacillus massiliglaciei]|uniref:helix-turn-helix transcriptional regulator n=1 Tax=Bacillus massiliglaciei TaxID=1816693 RepID=UPI000AA99957|nr:YafY family protein [Bacillus massiliglaciei]